MRVKWDALARALSIMNLQIISNRYYGFALIVICFITRLPQLLSPDLFLDGDECILGLMAKHVADGKEFPVYFYGQNYGFSSVEAVFGGLSFLMFGVSAIALRISLLLLWCVGIVFLFLLFNQVTDKKYAFMIALLMLLIPAWAIGSMKARGGYITAFTLTSILLYFLFKVKESPSLIASLFIGVLFILIYYSRPFWIPGLLPVLVYTFIWKLKYKETLPMIMGAMVTVVFFSIVIPNPNVYWEPKLLFNSAYWPALKEIPNRIYYNVAGSYELDRNIDLGFFVKYSTYIWDGILVLLLLVQALRLIFKKYLVWSHLLCLSVLLTLAYTPMFTQNYGARYLLPYTQFLILWSGIELIDFTRRKNYRLYLNYFIIVVCLFGFGAMVEFKDFNFMPSIKDNKSEQNRMDEVIKFLNDNKVRHVFSTDPLLQWQLTFYSKEEVISRWLDDKDRYPEYPKRVDNALKNGSPVAIVGLKEFRYGLDKNPITKDGIAYIGDRYFVFLNPKKEFLMSQKFAFIEN